MFDGTTLFLADIHSLKIDISTFNKFKSNSGLKININKTEIEVHSNFHKIACFHSLTDTCRQHLDLTLNCKNII